MDLRELVFFRCKAEYDCYMMMKDGDYTAEELAEQKARFMCAYQIIEEAELEREYQAWKEANPDA